MKKQKLLWLLSYTGLLLGFGDIFCFFGPGLAGLMTEGASKCIITCGPIFGFAFGSNLIFSVDFASVDRLIKSSLIPSLLIVVIFAIIVSIVAIVSIILVTKKQNKTKLVFILNCVMAVLIIINVVLLVTSKRSMIDKAYETWNNYFAVNELAPFTLTSFGGGVISYMVIGSLTIVLNAGGVIFRRFIGKNKI